MSSYTNCIKFSLDIEDPNIIFSSYYYEIINDIKFMKLN